LFLLLRFLTLTLFFLNVFGCREKSSPSVLDSIPQGKSLLSMSNFEVIDHFNVENGKNQFKQTWKINIPTGAEIKLSRDPEDAIYHGGSLGVEYSIPPNQTAGISTTFKTLDLSRAETVLMLVRSEDLKNYSGRLQLVLRDQRDNRQEIDIKKYVEETRGNWEKILIPKKDFGKINFDQIGEVQIEWRAGSKPVAGKMAIDEIAFAGPKELIFESMLDNLKGFPKEAIAESRRKELIGTKDEKEFLGKIAADTWKYFENVVDKKTALPEDHIRTGRTLAIGNYTGPTNIALYWLSCVGAYDLSLISEKVAIEKIKTSLDTLAGMEHPEYGFYYNFYETHTLRATKRYLSTIDNAWLAAALVVLRQAFPQEFSARANEIFSRMNFSKFYDEANGQLRIGFDEDLGELSPYHYGLLASEARLASYIGIGKGDLKQEHWARIYRTLPKEWNWQKQVPQGSPKVLLNVPIFQGFYTYRDKKFVPSWGGSLFEYLAPTLVVDEQTYGRENLGRNNEIVTDLHILYAIRDKKYPVWGIAPCAIQYGRNWQYKEYGIPELAAKGYPDEGVVAPYASFLALATRPKNAVENFRNLLAEYDEIYGEFGFYDSVVVASGKVDQQYLLIDQAMNFIAMVNYLKQGSITKRFHSDPVGKKAEVLLKEEKFF